MHVVARVLISLFFMDCCLADYQNWQFYQTPLMKSRVASYPHRYKDPGVPHRCIPSASAMTPTAENQAARHFMQCAPPMRLCCRLPVPRPAPDPALRHACDLRHRHQGGGQHLGAGHALGQCRHRLYRLVSAHSRSAEALCCGSNAVKGGVADIGASCRVRMIQHRLEPDELTVKHLAMLGSAALLLAHSVRGRHAANNTVAGRACHLAPKFYKAPYCLLSA